LNDALITIRSAVEHDQLAITNLVRSERLNPNDLDWRRFLVATYDSGVVGAVQLRQHVDTSRELGSLVVRKDARRRGIASRLVDALLSTVRTRVFMIASAPYATHYARWGFQRISAVEAPSPIVRNYALGQLIGGFVALLCGRSPRRLVILDRRAPAPATER
jgi:N-acetylglutamate synthase-like GNAT family acetyltransferase